MEANSSTPFSADTVVGRLCQKTRPNCERNNVGLIEDEDGEGVVLLHTCGSKLILRTMFRIKSLLLNYTFTCLSSHLPSVFPAMVKGPLLWLLFATFFPVEGIFRIKTSPSPLCSVESPILRTATG